MKKEIKEKVNRFCEAVDELKCKIEEAEKKKAAIALNNEVNSKIYYLEIPQKQAAVK